MRPLPTEIDYSTSPSGERFPIPAEADYAQEFARVETLSNQARAEGKEVVVVMGLGFVGAVMAAIVADARVRPSSPSAPSSPSPLSPLLSSKFVIGCQRPSVRSFWKTPMLNRGESPVKAEDPEVAVLIKRCVLESKTLTATYNSDCLSLADCVVVDVQCDYIKHDLGNMRSGEADMAKIRATSAKARGQKAGLTPDLSPGPVRGWPLSSGLWPVVSQSASSRSQ